MTKSLQERQRFVAELNQVVTQAYDRPLIQTPEERADADLDMALMDSLSLEELQVLGAGMAEQRRLEADRLRAEWGVEVTWVDHRPVYRLVGHS
jgi:hypothetical protein